MQERVEANTQRSNMTQRFWVSFALTFPLLAVAMRNFVPQLVGYIPAAHATWLALIISAPIVLWGGSPFFVRGWRSIVARRFNIFALIGLGVGVAYVYGVVATLAPGIFPGLSRAGGSAVISEVAAMLTTLLLLEQVLELRFGSRHK